MKDNALADWLGDGAQHYPDRIAVIDETSGRRHSYLSFDNRANQIAHFCDAWVGLEPGDCVGLLSRPSDDVLQILVAAGKLGLTALFLDPAASPESLIDAINANQPRAIFYGLDQTDLAHELWFDVDSVEHLFPLRGAVDTANFEDIVAYYPPTPLLDIPEVDVPWVRFAADGSAWPDLESVPAGDVSVDLPIYEAQGLAAAVTGLRSGQCVVIQVDGVKVIEPPDEVETTQEEGSESRRNVPMGRSWLPHEFW